MFAAMAAHSKKSYCVKFMQTLVLSGINKAAISADFKTVRHNSGKKTQLS